MEPIISTLACLPLAFASEPLSCQYYNNAEIAAAGLNPPHVGFLDGYLTVKATLKEIKPVYKKLSDYQLNLIPITESDWNNAMGHHRVGIVTGELTCTCYIRGNRGAGSDIMRLDTWGHRLHCE